MCVRTDRFFQRHSRPMPRFNNSKSLIALRTAALFFLFQRLLGILFVALVAYGGMVFRIDVIHAGLLAGGLWIGLRLAQFLMFRPCRCPLCLGAVFARSRCLPHVKAKRLFGSFRLASSLGILLKGRFKCVFCGTRLSLTVADRRAGSCGEDDVPVRFRSLGGQGRPGMLRISRRGRTRKSALR